MIITKNYALGPVNRKEALRYAGVRNSTPEMEAQLDQCLKLAVPAVAGRVCFTRVPVSVENGVVDLSFAKVESRALSKNLMGCEEAVVFAATVGLGIDRLIRRMSMVDMAQAVWMQAVGAERVEAVCQAFNDEIRRQEQEKGRYTRPRFSPGYGDVPLTLQQDFCRVLDCSKHIGVSLSESMLLSPSKSVTAIIGIGDKMCRPETESCSFCDKTDCPFRKENI